MTSFHRDILRPSTIRAPGAASGGDPFELWRLEPLTLAEFSKLGDEGAAPHQLSLAQLRYLAAYNLLAPSSHNTVPQRFLFPRQANAIDVYLDRAVILAASDPVGRQASISLGCGLANLVHAARRYGFDTRIELDETLAAGAVPQRPGEPRYQRAAMVCFQRISSEQEGPLAPLLAMLERRTVRADYNASVVLPAELASALTTTMRSGYPQLEFHLVSDADTICHLGDLQELADTTMLSREDFTNELGQWIMDNHSDSPLGMRGREYGLTDAMTRGVQHRLSQAALSAEEVAVLARAGNVGVRSASAVAIIAVPRDDFQHRVLAGRAFEDLALLLHQHRFVTAVHAGMTEVLSACTALSARLDSKGRPIVVFRMGQPLEPRDSQRPHSARPSVDEVTLDESQADVTATRAAS